MKQEMVTVTIHMPETLHSRLREFSRERGLSVTEMMRNAVGEYMRQQERTEPAPDIDHDAIAAALQRLERDDPAVAAAAVDIDAINAAMTRATAHDHQPADGHPDYCLGCLRAAAPPEATEVTG